MSGNRKISIGGASGYWGESAMATPQLLEAGDVDYIVYDYLAEITMSILARARAKDPAKGYATDFIDFVMRPHLPLIAQKGVKIIANAGGVNPQGCADALHKLIGEYGLDLKVAVVMGDDLLERKEELAQQRPAEMFTGADFPDPKKIASINAYLGAFPIAKALDMGADIVVTGRCVDSAVTLGACIHEFGWGREDWDLLAAGSLAGHIIECGPQCCGGNFTDWESVPDITNIGYPIATISADGGFVTSKAPGTGGLINRGTIGEQLLYEIGDPAAYYLPDVICDFTEVKITEIGENKVEVTGACGRPAPSTYKICMTYADGFRAGNYLTFYGVEAKRKAEKFAGAAIERAERSLRNFNFGEFTEVSEEILGAGSQTGRTQNHANEVVLKLAVKHPDMRGVGLFLKEVSGLALATPPGLSGFSGVRSKPSPVVRLFSFVLPKEEIEISVSLENAVEKMREESGIAPGDLPMSQAGAFPENLAHQVGDAEFEIPLIKLAWGRSGDKGDKSNIGIMARKREYLPFICAALTPERIAQSLSHFVSDDSHVERFYLDGIGAVNFLIDAVLGGGGAASLRNDPQGKGYAQILLAQPVKVSKEIAEQLA